ncbi:hypothetical protein MKW98_016195 [Papaver atlanticum]|uniref:Uncharacterized protein n=1 Tax=Papaver atlanticum TaxID=357466 RepID=A0AAD4SH43_9MAGN|nr:hypothetical protein MKW98_016195 [Papaver atlanticum]
MEKLGLHYLQKFIEKIEPLLFGRYMLQLAKMVEDHLFGVSLKIGVMLVVRSRERVLNQKTKVTLCQLLWTRLLCLWLLKTWQYQGSVEECARARPLYN